MDALWSDETTDYTQHTFGYDAIGSTVGLTLPPGDNDDQQQYHRQRRRRLDTQPTHATPSASQSPHSTHDSHWQTYQSLDEPPPPPRAADWPHGLAECAAHGSAPAIVLRAAGRRERACALCWQEWVGARGQETIDGAPVECEVCGRAASRERPLSFFVPRWLYFCGGDCMSQFRARLDGDSRPAQHFTEPDLYQVETLLGERRRARGVEFLVKWLGYPRSDATWEPEGNILDNSLIWAWRSRPRVGRGCRGGRGRGGGARGQKSARVGRPADDGAAVRTKLPKRASSPM